MTIKIGTWNEKESRVVTQLTSYAADHIEVETKVGTYDLSITFEGGYTIPMPQYLLAGIDAEVIGGGYYSGFCGNNFAFSPATLGPTKENVQMYSYQLAGLVESGKVTLDPGWDWLMDDIPWESDKAPKTWDDVRQLA